MRRRYIQFETPSDSEHEVAKEVRRNGLKIALIILVSLVLLAGIEWVVFNAEKIDNEVEMHINHLMYGIRRYK